MYESVRKPSFETGRFNTIDHKFLVTGHSFLPSDRRHCGVIKHRKRKTPHIYIPEEGRTPVKEWAYRKVFCTEYNLSFGAQKSDTCQVCDRMNMKVKTEGDPELEQQLKIEWETHRPRANTAFVRLKDTENAKNSRTWHMISFDLQQALPTPYLTTGAVFYLRQLWTYNLAYTTWCRTVGTRISGQRILQEGDQMRWRCVF